MSVSDQANKLQQIIFVFPLFDYCKSPEQCCVHLCGFITPPWQEGPSPHSLTKQHFFHHIDMGGGLWAPMGLQMESFELRMRYSSNFLLSVGEIELLHLPRWGKGDGWG